MQKLLSIDENKGKKKRQRDRMGHKKLQQIEKKVGSVQKLLSIDEKQGEKMRQRDRMGHKKPPQSWQERLVLAKAYFKRISASFSNQPACLA